MREIRIKLISILVSALAVGLFLAAAPHFIRMTILSENRVAYDQPIPGIAHGYAISQQFVPQYDHVEGIEIYINTLSCDVSQGSLRVNILDAGRVCVYEGHIELQTLPAYGMTEIAQEIQLQAGSTYFLEMEAVDTVDAGPAVSFYPTSTAACTEEAGMTLAYGGLSLEDSVLRVAFRYSVPPAVGDKIVYCLFLIFVCCFLVEKGSRVSL